MERWAIPCFSFVGRSGVGKTTVLERVVAALAQRGYRVAAIKHTRHADLETDLPGKDTRRFWDAGAVQTVLITPERVAQVRRVAAPALGDVLAGIRDVDVVLVEGDKTGPLPKIEVVRAACAPDVLPDLVGRIACVTDVPDLSWDGLAFALDADMALANFIEEWIVAAQAGMGGWEELEHTADLALRVWAPDLPGLFVAAARGMFSLSAAATAPTFTHAEQVTLRAGDREALLVDWLNELLYLSEAGAGQWAYGAFRFETLTGTALRALALGAQVTARRNEVKAATFHDIAIRQSAVGLETTLVFDM
ncbi:MAG TPA: molybdopterin-guanine dinucleotide biosynthesis protein B [Anaerolineae bacterium]|nr:molybdopterin-guanine dinucleotide biosynthesis protein B [Anaerolineae bacterium]HRT32352.1 molybdopterin-guanine dinucleotide biosynthesis protein B [Anaerolineae bacterium]HRU93807.1 molybdopterin-guanine dinucleotide biosynthesis protein B [Anaerolineae bacterium]HXK41296.1 molybdopterin-guanine dinucleotide biosynthesis protein B [Anaerolineae bacterium]